MISIDAHNNVVPITNIYYGNAICNLQKNKSTGSPLMSKDRDQSLTQLTHKQELHYFTYKSLFTGFGKHPCVYESSWIKPLLASEAVDLKNASSDVTWVSVSWVDYQFENKSGGDGLSGRAGWCRPLFISTQGYIGCCYNNRAESPAELSALLLCVMYVPGLENQRKTV